MAGLSTERQRAAVLSVAGKIGMCDQTGLGESGIQRNCIVARRKQKAIAARIIFQRLAPMHFVKEQRSKQIRTLQPLAHITLPGTNGLSKHMTPQLLCNHVETFYVLAHLEFFND
ncbi:hypothetical protein PSEUDO9AZ_40892 [Pseudomonas sp. 9AZ]|nr:hypothetical protein PSEUDO9AZ_40892 [Pseudomonas sp. 9AZ]